MNTIIVSYIVICDDTHIVFDFSSVVFDVELRVGHARLAIQTIVIMVEVAFLQERCVGCLEGV